jgi:hypothetical protein
MGGKLVAEYRDGTTYFRHDDHLGTARVLTMMNQAIHDSADYQPFGEDGWPRLLISQAPPTVEGAPSLTFLVKGG